jgi:hypothetical protein
MIALIWFVLAVLTSPFKLKGRLEPENAVLRHQLIVLRRKLESRARSQIKDRWFLVQMYRCFPSILRGERLINVTANPEAEWVARQITETSYMIRDRDRCLIAHRPHRPALPSRPRLNAAASIASLPRPQRSPYCPLLGDETAGGLDLIWVRGERNFF